jgi:hypothetical protein
LKYLNKKARKGLFSRFKQADKVRELEEYEKQLRSDMLELIDKSKTEGMKIVNSMIKYEVPTQNSPTTDLFTKMIIDIKHEILGCLLRVPYFTLLKPDPSG